MQLLTRDPEMNAILERTAPWIAEDFQVKQARGSNGRHVLSGGFSLALLSQLGGRLEEPPTLPRGDLTRGLHEVPGPVVTYDRLIGGDVSVEDGGVGSGSDQAGGDKKTGSEHGFVWGGLSLPAPIE